MEEFYKIVNPIKAELKQCVHEATDCLAKAKSCINNEEKLELAAKGQKAAAVAQEVLGNAEDNIPSFLENGEVNEEIISEFYKDLEQFGLQLQHAEKELNKINPEQENESATTKQKVDNLVPTLIMKDDGKAIATSNKKTDMLTWKQFLEDNWDRLMVKDTTVLVLTGVHGESDGTIKKIDKSLVEQDQLQKENLLKPDKFGQKANEDDIKIELFDIGPLVSEHYLKEKNLKMLQTELVKSIKSLEQEEDMKGRKFTFLLFSYCHTQNNVVTDLLRLDAMCSRLIIERDLFELYGRRISWSDEQMAALQWVIENPTKHVFFTGGYGTGKTLLASEVAKIKVAHYRTMAKESVQVIVNVGSRMSIKLNERHQFVPLENYFKELFAAWSDNINVLSFRDLDMHTLSDTELRGLIETMRQYANKDVKRKVFLIDEFDPYNLSFNFEWFKNLLKQKEDLIFVLRPSTRTTYYEEIPGMQLHLSRNYRNCFAIDRLLRFVMHHDRYVQDKKKFTKERKESDYPPGSMPVWVEIDKENVTADEAVGYLQKQPEYKGMLRDGEFYRFDKDILEYNFRGAEWSTVVWSSRFGSISEPLLAEYITRARNHLFILTSVYEKNRFEQIFETAYDHSNAGFDCEICRGKDWSFVGKKPLLENPWPGMTLTKVNGELQLKTTKIVLEENIRILKDVLDKDEEDNKNKEYFRRKLEEYNKTLGSFE